MWKAPAPQGRKVEDMRRARKRDWTLEALDRSVTYSLWFDTDSWRWCVKVIEANVCGVHLCPGDCGMWHVDDGF